MSIALNRTSLPIEHMIGSSAPTPPGIVHLGLGQFSRAHMAVYTAQAMAARPEPWGILGVANQSHAIVNGLRAQDNLYTVLSLAPEHEQAGIVDAITGTLVAADQSQAVIAAIAAATTRIVTLTITEKGYNGGPDGRLNIHAPAIAEDLTTPDRPTSPLGILATGLWRRWLGDATPLSVLSCDNMMAAGHTTHDRVVQYLDDAGAPSGLFDWLFESVSFPNAMVDRIVPATTDATRDAVERILGVRDAVPVPAEQFTMWVLEDAFAAGRPAWETAGAIFTDEVAKYELIKLRLLNGCYSLLSTMGVLAGEETNPGAITTDYIAACVHAAQDDEYMPTLSMPTGFDAQSYIVQLFERWGNTALGDATWRVATDGSAKLAQRIVVPATFALERGSMPQQMALTAAVWLCATCPPPGFDPGPVAAKVVEPKAAAMQAAAAGATSVRDHALRVMRGGILPDELTKWDSFDDRVADFVEIIASHGVKAAAQEALASR